MKKDVRKKVRPPFRISSKYVQVQLLGVLKLTDELQTVYQTYPKLRKFVGDEAWQRLTDVPYQQLLQLNLHPRDKALRNRYAKNMIRLEDIMASTRTRDRAGLKHTLSQVLIYRIENGLALQEQT